MAFFLRYTLDTVFPRFFNNFLNFAIEFSSGTSTSSNQDIILYWHFKIWQASKSLETSPELLGFK